MSKESKKSNLTQEQVKFFEEAFHDFDKDSDGMISSKELGMILKSLGMDLTDTELMDLINEVDTDGNGTVDTKEFLNMMERKMNEASEINKGGEGLLREAFHIFDKDGDGFISTAELHLLMTSLGEKMSKTDVDGMMRWADKDGDGGISYKEFKSFMKTVGKDYQ